MWTAAIAGASSIVALRTILRTVAILATVQTARPATTATVRLRDGRRLAYDDVGDPTGPAVLYFHGGGDSRLTRHPDDAVAGELGVRLIAVDRPGSGRSDLRPGRSLVEWAADVD